MKRFATYGSAWAFLQALLLLFASPAMAREKLVLAFGDSLTAGYGLAAGQSFPAQLQSSLRKQGLSVRVHNAGVSGETTAAGRARLNWVLASLKVKPDLVILELGANDMLRGLPPAQARANLDAMLTELNKRNVPVLLAGMRASFNLDKTYRAQFDGMYPALAKKHRVRFYPFFMEGVAGNRSLLLKDQLHPTAPGVAIIVRRIQPMVSA
ncbi:MAG: arylesterase, partial [Chakrabartia godavariana]